MFLIADSGSTKTEWALIDRGSLVKKIQTKGFNPYYYQKAGFVSDIKDKLQKQVSFGQIKKVFYYGSGCSSERNCTLVETSLKEVFFNAQIEIEHDLFAAGLALLGEGKGIACILGTGSNSCLWENKKIIANVPSLGYMLGDEGSGTHIGKLLLKGILLGEAGTRLAQDFYAAYDLDFTKSLDRIYRKPDPNLFYASLSPFVKKNIDKPFCKAVVKQSFSEFVLHYLSKYKAYQSLPVSFSGSVAFHFQDILKEVVAEHQMTLGHILPHPMEGLVAYHLGHYDT
jgi:N-acetylglucosamine kinase-like BadF-type ATPase